MSTSMTMDMGTATSSGAMPTATEHDMGGMGGMGDGCKISVSFNSSPALHTVANMDVLCRCCGTGTPSMLVCISSALPVTGLRTYVISGFISSSWHIRSKGMFAGSCIGVLLLVVALEALRRASREYDAYIARSHQKNNTSFPPLTAASSRLEEANDPNKVYSTQSTTPILQAPTTFTPNVFQQLIRAFLHMAQFAVAYIVMLLAMYYNGYMIICIFLGAFVGAFVFDWHSMALP